MNKIFKYN